MFCFCSALWTAGLGALCSEATERLVSEAAMACSVMAVLRVQVLCEYSRQSARNPYFSLQIGALEDTKRRWVVVVVLKNPPEWDPRAQPSMFT